jgi:hypothetical protein
MQIAGVDFTSAPSRRKPITIALGRLRPDATVVVDKSVSHADFASFLQWLRSPGPWIAALDFPFGLPRAPGRGPRLAARVAAVGPPLHRPVAGPDSRRLPGLLRGAAERRQVRAPRVRCLLHRLAVDEMGQPAGRLHAARGIGLLLEAGVQISTLHAGDPDRVALEGYPGLLARELIGRRSYKSDTRAMQTAERRDARLELLRRLERGESRLGLRIALDAAQRRALVDDGSADRLDAVLCLMQAAWASERPGYGLPDDVDPLEGWIVSAVR